MENRVQTDQMFRTLAETLPQIVWMSNEAGEILYFNPQWYAYTGMPLGKVTSKDWKDIVHPDDLKGIEQKVLDSNTFHRGYEAEYRLRKKDGTYRWHLGRSVIIQDPVTQAYQRIGSATDIHEQKETQEANLVLRQRTESIIQDAPILLWAVNQEGVFTYYDGKVKTILGITTEERIGKNILELYHDRPEIAGNVKRALKGEIVVGESQIGAISLDNKFSPQYDATGRINGVIGLSVDVTERKRAQAESAKTAIQAESALETAKLKSQFLANMSHEIRTPLNGVLGMTGLLLDTSLTQEQKEFASAIQRSGESLLTLINDILDFSKIEAGKLDFEDTPFELTEVFSDVAKSMNFTAEKKQLSIDLKLDFTLPFYVSGDCGRFRQVLVNLLGNAIKFSENGNIRIHSKVEHESNRELSIRVEVTDPGIGIPEATLTKLFTPFTQADASTTRTYGGSGLGLSISRGLIEKMGGEIGAISEVGRGSTFWFTCRFKRTSITAETHAVSQALPLARPKLEGRILVAEDNPVNQIIAVKMLEKFGFRADVVANGHEAIEALHQLPYDLVLMDCQMPELDGYEATSLIRQSTTLKNPLVPIVALTANAMKGDAEKCLSFGMNAYISKPVKPERLIEVIEKYLSIKR